MTNIRNFAIVAHIDHGKSTLADRLMELTGTVAKRDLKEQMLDSNPIERERGITIKLAPVRMIYKIRNSKHEIRNNDQNSNSQKIKSFEFRNSDFGFADSEYILNLIDTPGHVDFSYEVSRSLAACEGVILLVDATQGVQAQTLAHYNQAKKLGLVIIPVVNKIDVGTAEIHKSVLQMQQIFGFSPEDILKVSAKTGEGVTELLSAIIQQIPNPKSQIPNQTRALVFNSNYDIHLGVVAWIRLFDGEIKIGDKLLLLGTKTWIKVIEVGVFAPQRKIIEKLSAGEVGYIVTSLKDISLLTVGDTISNDEKTSVLPGYSPIMPVVFMSFYPTDGAEINLMRDALEKLKMTDSALTYFPEHSPALGNGFRIGALGLLHTDIIQERLEREFGLTLIACAPSVAYELLTINNKLITISKAGDLPDPSQIKELREPMIRLSVFVSDEFIGPVIQLCQSCRAQLQDMTYIGTQVSLVYQMPFAEMLREFYDRLKSVSSGYATIDYEFIGFVASDLVRLDILVNTERVDAFSQIVPRVNVNFIGKNLVDKLRQAIPRQQYEVAIQAAIGGKIVARADIKAYRKDVIAKLSGGDQTRKDKLLKIQKKGKARMKSVGRIEIPQEAFLMVLKV